jgi:hypothetical protein
MNGLPFEGFFPGMIDWAVIGPEIFRERDDETHPQGIVFVTGNHQNRRTDCTGIGIAARQKFQKFSC